MTRLLRFACALLVLLLAPQLEAEEVCKFGMDSQGNCRDAQEFKPPPPPVPQVIKIRSAPSGADILIGDKVVGQTPFVLPRKVYLPKLQLILRKEGYDDFPVDLPVSPHGFQQTEEYVLSPKKATLQIRLKDTSQVQTALVTVARANIRPDGTFVADQAALRQVTLVAPRTETVPLEPGVYVVRAQSRGYLDFVDVLQLDRGQSDRSSLIDLVKPVNLKVVTNLGKLRIALWSKCDTSSTVERVSIANKVSEYDGGKYVSEFENLRPGQYCAEAQLNGLPPTTKLIEATGETATEELYVKEPPIPEIGYTDKELQSRNFAPSCTAQNREACLAAGLPLAAPEGSPTGQDRTAALRLFRTACSSAPPRRSADVLSQPVEFIGSLGRGEAGAGIHDNVTAGASGCELVGWFLRNRPEADPVYNGLSQEQKQAFRGRADGYYRQACEAGDQHACFGFYSTTTPRFPLRSSPAASDNQSGDSDTQFAGGVSVNASFEFAPDAKTRPTFLRTNLDVATSEEIPFVVRWRILGLGVGTLRQRHQDGSMKPATVGVAFAGLAVGGNLKGWFFEAGADAAGTFGKGDGTFGVEPRFALGFMSNGWTLQLGARYSLLPELAGKLDDTSDAATASRRTTLATVQAGFPVANF